MHDFRGGRFRLVRTGWPRWATQAGPVLPEHGGELGRNVNVTVEDVSPPAGRVEAARNDAALTSLLNGSPPQQPRASVFFERRLAAGTVSESGNRADSGARQPQLPVRSSPRPRSGRLWNQRPARPSTRRDPATWRTAPSATWSLRIPG